MWSLKSGPPSGYGLPTQHSVADTATGAIYTRTSSFPRVSRWRLCHSKEPSARDRKMRDFCQGFRALGSMDRDLVWLYCVIEDVVRQILGETRLRSRGPTLELTDVESLTIEIFGETLGLNSDASIWRYACDHLRDWFPGLGTEWNFVRRCANLCWLNVQDALFHPSRDWNAFFRCRCASTHGRGGISGSGAMVRLRRQAGEVLRLQGADELGRGDLPVVAGHHRRARDA